MTSEVCDRPTALERERATVYDQHFEEIRTEPVEDYVKFEGEPFMEHLERLASKGP